MISTFLEILRNVFIGRSLCAHKRVIIKITKRIKQSRRTLIILVRDH